MTVDEAVAEEAVKPIKKMLEISEKLDYDFCKDNKMWLIKDVSVILKSKGEFFWKGFIIGIGVTFLFH